MKLANFLVVVILLQTVYCKSPDSDRRTFRKLFLTDIGNMYNNAREVAEEPTSEADEGSRKLTDSETNQELSAYLDTNSTWGLMDIFAQGVGKFIADATTDRISRKALQGVKSWLQDYGANSMDKAWDEVKAIIATASAYPSEDALRQRRDVMESMKNAWNEVVKTLSDAGDAVVHVFKPTEKSVLDKMADGVNEAGSAVVNAFKPTEKSAFDKMADGIKSLGQ